MSTLKLNLHGSVEPIMNYFKNFMKISSSLLIEIDTDVNAFIAKTFTVDRGAIRFSSISFKDANIKVVSDTCAERSSRIKTGIVLQLGRFIKMIGRFGAKLDKEGNSDFIIRIEYSEMLNPNGEKDFVATTIGFEFESNELRMKLDGFKISELSYLSDEKFNKEIYNVEDYVMMDLPCSTISSIIKTSDIIKIDPRYDSLEFFVENNEVYVKDHVRKEAEPNFVFKIGSLSSNLFYDVDAVILREKFIQMLDGADEDYKLVLGHRKTKDGGYMVDRLLFESANGSTRVVIAILNK